MPGADPDTDFAIERMPHMRRYCSKASESARDTNESAGQLKQVMTRENRPTAVVRAPAVQGRAAPGGVMVDGQTIRAIKSGIRAGGAKEKSARDLLSRAQQAFTG